MEESKRTERQRLQSLGGEDADVVLRNCRLVNVLSGEIEDGVDIAIGGERIVGVGKGYRARCVIDCEGSYAYPGLIDAHIHLESTKLTIGEASRIMSRYGTTAIVTDPHEIANVAGLAGFMYQYESARQNCLIDVYFTAPSCVPTLSDASIETAGANLDAETLSLLARLPSVVGLGELMNVPGVLNGDAKVLKKIDTFLSMGKVVDGHCPMLSGQALNAYVAAGISSDHESTSLEEAREKLRRGMFIMIREGSSERNLEALLPLVDEKGRNVSRLMFASDDLDPLDLCRRGHINGMLRRAVLAGIDPVMAVQMATSSPARYFGLDREIGAIAPGMRANIVISDDLTDFCPRYVVFHGCVREIESMGLRRDNGVSPYLHPTMNASLPDIEALRVPYREGMRLRTIDLVERQIVTKEGETIPRVVGGYVEASPVDDVAKVCVFDRHRASGAFGLGFVRGFGLKRGAIGSSVVHDSHHLIVVGADDVSILACARRIMDMGGGQAAVCGEEFAQLALPVGGLMSGACAEAVCHDEENLTRFCRESLGVMIDAPFAAMSFMALPVIPEIRVTDRGLFRISPAGSPECVDVLL